MSQLSLAVIGLGVGKKHAAHILSKEVDARLAAVCDMNPKFSGFAKDMNANFYEDYKEMLKKEKIDGVVVATPPGSHSDIGIYCLQHGANVLVEKPVTSTLDEADRLIEAADKTGMKLLVGHQHRFDAGVELTKKKIADGELGKVVGFNVFSVYHKSPSYYSIKWRTEKASGGGVISNNGIHDLDRIRYIYGDVEEVHLCASSEFRGLEVADTIAICFRCKSGAVGTMYISDCSHPPERFTDWCFGSEATVMFNCSSMYSRDGRNIVQKVSWNNLDVMHDRRDKIVEVTELPEGNNHLKEMIHFCNVIKGLEEPRCTGEDAKKSLEVLQKILDLC